MRAAAAFAMASMIVPTVASAQEPSSYFFRPRPMVIERAEPPAPVLPVELRGATLPRVTVGQPWTYDFASQASNVPTSGAVWSATGMPAPLALDAASGLGSGAPAAAGTFEFDVDVTANGTSAKARYTLVVEGRNVSAMDVGVGTDFTCALDPAGTVSCWGSNAYGQLGNGGTTTSLKPVAVTGLVERATALSVGYQHACVIGASGAVRCWGRDYDSALGGATAADRTVKGLSEGATSISAGHFNTCVVTKLGAAKCWGNGSLYALGNGGTGNRSTPTQVDGLTTGIKAVSISYQTGCAIKSDNSLVCWGQGVNGEIGDNGKVNRSTPSPVAGMGSGVSDIGTGMYHTCAVKDGRVACWGFYSDIGYNASSNVPTPMNVTPAGTTFVDVEGNSFNSSTCALTAAGEAWCWGYTGGNIGTATTGKVRFPEKVVADGTTFSKIKVGPYSVCGVADTGKAMCWGGNTSGEAGNGTTKPVRFPTAVSLD